jgi:tetratricopeptide (TPR) repeat protein
MVGFTQSGFDSIISIVDTINFDTSKVNYLNKTSWKLRKSDYKTTLKLAEFSISYAERINYTKGYISALNIAGTIHAYKGEYEEALHHFFKVLNISKEKNLNKHKANALNNIGNINYFMGNYDKTIDYLSQAIKLYEQLNNKNGIASGYKNIGNIYYHLKDYTKGLYYHRKSLKQYLKINDMNGAAGCYHNIANYFYHEKQNDSAIYYNSKALDIYRNLKNKQGLLITSLTQSELWINEQNPQKAGRLLKTARRLVDELGTDFNSAILYRNLSKYDSLNNDFKNAFKNYKTYVRIKDSINSKEEKAELNRIQTKYEVEAKIRENELQKERIGKQLYIIIGLFIIILLFGTIVSVLVYFNIRQKKANRRIKEQQSKIIDKEKELTQTKLQVYKQDLLTKQKELTSNALFLLQANEKNKKLLEELETIIAKSPSKIAKELKSIAQEYKIHKDNSFWENFETRFEKVHQEFYNNLDKKFPDLTPAEKKLCAFLKLNMSTKEISAITLSSESGVNVARSRLRNKLQLSREINLVTFLSKL